MIITLFYGQFLSSFQRQIQLLGNHDLTINQRSALDMLTCFNLRFHYKAFLHHCSLWIKGKGLILGYAGFASASFLFCFDKISVISTSHEGTWWKLIWCLIVIRYVGVKRQSSFCQDSNNLYAVFCWKHYLWDS